MPAKIKTLDELATIARTLAAEGRTVVTTNGSFDILHAAHVQLLQRAKEQGDVLIVLLNGDLSIRKFKGDARPIVPQAERAQMLAALACVDYIAIFDEDTPLACLAAIRPHKHVKGGSFIEERTRKERELLASFGGQFVQFPLEESFSTTNIINRILQRYGNAAPGQDGSIRHP